MERYRHKRLGDVFVIKRNDMLARRVVDFHTHLPRILIGPDTDASCAIHGDVKYVLTKLNRFGHRRRRRSPCADGRIGWSICASVCGCAGRGRCIRQWCRCRRHRVTRCIRRSIGSRIRVCLCSCVRRGIGISHGRSIRSSIGRGISIGQRCGVC